MIWLHFVRRLAFWGGVRAMTSAGSGSAHPPPARRAKRVLASPLALLAVGGREVPL